MSDNSPKTLNVEPVSEAHKRLYNLVRNESITEGRAIRSAIVLVATAFNTREHYADDSALSAREIQFLVDLRSSSDELLTASIAHALKFSELTLQEVANLVGISREAVLELYRYPAP